MKLDLPVTVGSCALLVLGFTIAGAQTRLPIRFEVASAKRTTTENPQMVVRRPRQGRFSAVAVTPHEPPTAMFDANAVVQCGLRLALGHISGMSVTMAEVADAISREAKRPVIDESGIRSKVDLVLNYTPEAVQLLRPEVAVQLPQNGFPVISTAIREQLGLRLVADDAPIEVLIIEQLNRPSPN
jgi:hypothetical protein